MLLLFMVPNVLKTLIQNTAAATWA